MNNTLTLSLSKRVFNPAFLPTLEDQHRYLVFYGGAGSGKSYFIAQRYLYRLLKRPMANLLVVRAVANTNRDSTFALFCQVIAGWKLRPYFQIKESDLRITCCFNGNSILFKGLDDSEKLKSITFPKGEVTDIWIEEASEVSQQDFNQLDVRLRGGQTPKQMVLSFNPVDVNHWLKRRFFDYKDPNALVLHTTYRDNRFLDSQYKAVLESYKETDPYYYDVYCLGRWGVYGKTVFPAAVVQEQLTWAREHPPVKRGYFVYTTFYDRERGTVRIEDESIRLQECEDGPIAFYEEPQDGHPYVVGGDTAGEGSDWFVGQVVDNHTGVQAATLRQQTDEDLFAGQLYCLGRYFHQALLAVEANFSTYPIRALEKLGYENQYVRQQEDRYTHSLQKAFGFKTTAVTRPIILAQLIQKVRQHPHTLRDPDTLEEMLTFVRSAKGRPEAQSGAHDDCIMALAIAEYVRERQRGEIETPPPPQKKIPWELRSDEPETNGVMDW